MPICLMYSTQGRNVCGVITGYSSSVEGPFPQFPFPHWPFAPLHWPRKGRRRYERIVDVANLKMGWKRGQGPHPECSSSGVWYEWEEEK